MQSNSEQTPCLSLYLTEIGKVKLLTPEQEIELANRIKAGDEAAREHMIKANLRLVVKIAREYEGIGLPLMDLIGEGNIGLMKAVERYDPTVGARLSTYAIWWMQQTLGREATDEEIADKLGIKTSRVTQMRVASIRPASLDARIGDDDAGTLADVVEDENVEAPQHRLEEEGMKSRLRELVQSLTPREADIISSRFGLDGKGKKTLEEVGQQFGVTRERVRQIESKALTKLRTKLQRLENADI
jgi:RNA polymerase primary sigma factor